jgi:hypothetical protein
LCRYTEVENEVVHHARPIAAPYYDPAAAARAAARYAATAVGLYKLRIQLTHSA